MFSLQTFAVLLVSVFFVFPMSSIAYAEEQGLDQEQGMDQRLEMAIALMQADGTDAGVKKLAGTMVQHHAAVVSAQHPNIKPESLEKYKTYLSEELLSQKPDLLHVIAGLYSQYFTAEEIQQLVAFYQTDLGKKAVEAGLQMQEKVFVLFNQWGVTAIQRAATRVHERLQEEGIVL